MYAVRVPFKVLFALAALVFLTSFANSPTHAQERDFVRVAGVAPNDFLNIRSGPDASARILGRIPPHARGISRRAAGIGDWVLVRYNGVIGWAHGHFLAPETAEGSIGTLNDMEAGNYGIVGVPFNDVLQVRAFPSPISRKIAAIPANAQSIRLDRTHPNGWVLVNYGPARGWVNGRYLIRTR